MIAARDNHYIVPRANLRIGVNDMFGKRVLSFCHELCDVISYHYPVARRRKKRLEPFCAFDAERQTPI
jgi:hypothetical protein